MIIQINSRTQNRLVNPAFSMLVEFTGNSTEKLDAFVIVVVVSLFSLLSLEITAAPVGTDDIL